MKTDRWKKLKIGDVVLVILVCAAAVVSMVMVVQARAGVRGSLAIVEVNGEEVSRIKLGEGMSSRTIEVEGFMGACTIEVEGNRIRMLKSPCPEKICVGTGWAENAGDQIVCLPNRVVIRVEGGEADGVDTVTE